MTISFPYSISSSNLKIYICLSGVEIVKKALRVPALTIAHNAGVDAHVIVEKIMNEKADNGYDALNDEFVNLMERGIVDPTKVRIG